MKLGIACASGSAKGVFIHGVLSSFEQRGLVPDVYAASSSSSIPAAFAQSSLRSRTPCSTTTRHDSPSP